MTVGDNRHAQPVTPSTPLERAASSPREPVPFNRAGVVGNERTYVDQVLNGHSFASIGAFHRRCAEWLTAHCGGARAFLTPSCTHALEISALACGLGPGDEVILPSFTFTTTATAFARTGATLVFVDIEPGTMNVDPACVEAAITERTRAIVVMHYGGVACAMDRLNALAARHGLWLVEDAAQALLCTCNGRPLGTLGHFGTLSFHETKNIHCGEGGALLVRDADLVEPCERIQEKGTNRSRFLRGEVDKYTWETLGSSYALAELPSAFLLAQLEAAHRVIDERRRLWSRYHVMLEPLAAEGLIGLPEVPEGRIHNAHIFFIKTRDAAERQDLIAFLKDDGIHATFHYVPLHTSPGGRRYGRFAGEDRHTTRESERLLRLPLFYGLRDDQVVRVADRVSAFYGGDRA